VRVTGSGLSRLKKCQYVGRDDVPWIESAPGAAAEHGSEVHELIAAPFLGRNVGGSSRATIVARSFLAWFDGEFGSREGWIAEPAYVLDVERGEARFLGCNIAREYGERLPSEYAMSADLVRIDGDEAIVIDVKTGRRENVEAAEINTQIASIGVALRRLHGVSRVRGILAFVNGFGVSIDEVTLHALDLDAHEQELHDLAKATPTAEPNPGKHCQWCPAVSACPATNGAIVQLTPKNERRLPIVGSASAIESMDHARYQYLTLRAAKAAIDQAWEAVRIYADQNDGIELGDGRRYVKIEKTRETIDLEGPQHVAAMKAVLGDDATLAIEVSTSKTAIKDAARAAAKRTGDKIASLERKTLDALRAAGAVKTSTSTTYEETEPAPKALAG
jgi:hypothetical protein